MFEKSLYDLIRGLRNHKGNEREYIQASLRECKKEIRSNDMDLKATALLKLTYLEMFGHDMSWASFHVLEVMSSQKFLQKRVGYLGAVQSYRPDTEVMMLAENQLKKDITSPHIINTTLPLTAIPHVINPSMANSLLPDILPRLTHSSPYIRKKTVATLYRLALVYPETLRPAWPRIKERLQDENEHPSVTAAIVNVVCELGMRRPQDFLPLAPRLFDLLVQGGNNWMAIKLIKLFAILTPLEPRLIKKLLSPLTTIIKTTPAMSLLYECIHGIIQGGILEGVEGTAEGEEIAKLCVGKLRSMLVIEGDPNLKYVALLAFERIVQSHPYLVSLHQDVILECIDDPDVTIRMRALDLVVGMVSSENLTSIVGRLMRQLRSAPIATSADDPANDRGYHGSVTPHADSDDSDAEESLRPAEVRSNQPPPLPEEYRINAIKRILEMCSRDTYANITDFDWYLDVLIQLVRVCPATKPSTLAEGGDEAEEDFSLRDVDISYDIGDELQNVAVRVRSVRREATEAAQSLIMVDKRDQMFPSAGNGGRGVLEAAAWIVGEYASLLSNPDGTLTSLMHSSNIQLPSRTLSIYVQAIPKVFARLAGNDRVSWTPERKSIVSLLLARIIHYLEPLGTHPSIEVQERAVGFLELMKLAAEAVSGQEAGTVDGDYVEPPLLLTQAIPSLFNAMELNPVAAAAQRKVPVPDELDLDTPINENLQMLLRQAEFDAAMATGSEDDISRLYYERATVSKAEQPLAAADRLDQPKEEYVSSYQQSAEEEYLDPDILARRKAERKERNKDDPFYIGEGSSGVSTPLHNILRNNNGEELDIDSIPIMDLDLESKDRSGQETPSINVSAPPPRKPRRTFEITVDENIGGDSSSADSSRPELVKAPRSGKGKKTLLEVDSSGLGSLSLDDEDSGARSRATTQLEIERREAEEAEMARALKEVERLRLEMQRAAERIQAKNVPAEGVVVKRKKKKVRAVGLDDAAGSAGSGVDPAASSAPIPDEGEDGHGTVPVKKKKKKVKKAAGDDAGTTSVATAGDAAGMTPDDGTAIKPKKKKKKVRQVVFDEGPAPAPSAEA